MFSTAMRLIHVAILVFTFCINDSVSSSKRSTVQCAATRKNITTMTKDNLFFSKRTPLVIGHRGNPMEYQENTLAGYKSLLDLNVDGFETDVFLTKDKKLVLFHDVNTFKLTGVNRNITEMTYEEIKKLNLTKQVAYGKYVYNYTKTEKIPLLEDLLREMKDSGQLMILEMKPSYPPYDINHSRETGVEVAKMVMKMGLEKQVVLSSFDPFKLYYARKELSQLNVCFLVTTKYWTHAALRKYSMAGLQNLVGLKECLENVSSQDYGRFILESAAVCKAIGASSLDMDYSIYNNPKYSNDTFKMFKNNYGKEFSYGAWTIYKLKFSKKELDESEAIVQKLIDNGAGRLITDDAPRLLKKLGRPVRKNSAGASLALFGVVPHFILAYFLAFLSTDQ